MITYHYSNSLFWLRLFGYGFSVSTHPFRFSQRYGYKKYIKVGKVVIEYLSRT